MTTWPTLPDASERFVVEVASVVREVCAGDGDRDFAVRHLSVGVMRTHDAVRIAHQDRLNLQRAKLAVTAFRKVIAAGFDLDESGQKKWMHGLVFSLRVRRMRAPPV